MINTVFFIYFGLKKNVTSKNLRVEFWHNIIIVSVLVYADRNPRTSNSQKSFRSTFYWGQGRKVEKAWGFMFTCTVRYKICENQNTIILQSSWLMVSKVILIVLQFFREFSPMMKNVRSCVASSSFALRLR